MALGGVFLATPESLRTLRNEKFEREKLEFFLKPFDTSSIIFFLIVAKFKSVNFLMFPLRFGARLAKIDPFAHAQRLTAVLFKEGKRRNGRPSLTRA